MDDDMRPRPANDWIDGSMAKVWGDWRWSVEIFAEIQRWGERNCCRFILVSESTDFDNTLALKDRTFKLKLYVAPKPMRKETGLCELSVKNRDKFMAEFGPWFSGFLAGKGIISPGDTYDTLGPR